YGVRSFLMLRREAARSHGDGSCLASRAAARHCGPPAKELLLSPGRLARLEWAACCRRSIRLCSLCHRLESDTVANVCTRMRAPRPIAEADSMRRAIREGARLLLALVIVLGIGSRAEAQCSASTPSSSTNQRQIQVNVVCP